MCIFFFPIGPTLKPPTLECCYVCCYDCITNFKRCPLLSGLHGCVVASPVASQEEVQSHVKTSHSSTWVLIVTACCYFCWELASSPMSMWVLSGFSSFLPQSKDMQLRLIDDSTLCVNSCLFVLALWQSRDSSRVYCAFAQCQLGSAWALQP